MTRETFTQDCRAGLADVIEARLGWLWVARGDVFFRKLDHWENGARQILPGWIVKLHWGSAFVPVGWRGESSARCFCGGRAAA